MHGRPEGAARRASGNRGRDGRRAGSRRASRARRRWPRRGPRTAGCALRFGAGSPGRRRSPKADGATSRRAVGRTSERRCGDEAAGHPVKPGPCAFAGCGPIAPLRFGRLFWRHLVGTRWRDLSAWSGGSRVACRNASVRFRGRHSVMGRAFTNDQACITAEFARSLASRAWQDAGQRRRGFHRNGELVRGCWPGVRIQRTTVLKVNSRLRLRKGTRMHVRSIVAALALGSVAACKATTGPAQLHLRPDTIRAAPGEIVAPGGYNGLSAQGR